MKGRNEDRQGKVVRNLFFKRLNSFAWYFPAPVPNVSNGHPIKLVSVIRSVYHSAWMKGFTKEII